MVGIAKRRGRWSRTINKTFLFELGSNMGHLAKFASVITADRCLYGAGGKRKHDAPLCSVHRFPISACARPLVALAWQKKVYFHTTGSLHCTQKGYVSVSRFKRAIHVTVIDMTSIDLLHNADNPLYTLGSSHHREG